MNPSSGCATRAKPMGALRPTVTDKDRWQKSLRLGQFQSRIQHLADARLHFSYVGLGIIIQLQIGFCQERREFDVERSQLACGNRLRIRRRRTGTHRQCAEPRKIGSLQAATEAWDRGLSYRLVAWPNAVDFRQHGFGEPVKKFGRCEGVLVSGHLQFAVPNAGQQGRIKEAA